MPHDWMSPPHPSLAGPQLMCCSWHVMGVHLGGGGVPTHVDRFQMRYSSTLSWAVIAFVSHSAGNVVAGLVALFVTWKSLKMACPHWLAAPTGVSNV